MDIQDQIRQLEFRKDNDTTLLKGAQDYNKLVDEQRNAGAVIPVVIQDRYDKYARMINTCNEDIERYTKEINFWKQQQQQETENE